MMYFVVSGMKEVRELRDKKVIQVGPEEAQGRQSISNRIWLLNKTTKYGSEN